MNQPTETPSIAPGTVLAGKYRVERVLGAGGMGMVVLAHHLELDERVAIKFLLPEALTNGEASARFSREARASVKIKSEHVARTLDVAKLEDGTPYMVMEYLDGMDLAARLSQRGPLGVAEAVSFVLQTCEALADAHALGIVHRDLKPSNLFVIRKTDGTESIKVLDFGISKLTRTTGSEMSMTRTASIMGSPLYMSPEQMASARNVDARSDIWALGVTLHELLAGRPPFVAETLPELCIQVATLPAPSVRERRPDVPEGLDTVIRRCLAKSREERYANVAELAAALVQYAPPEARPSADRVSRVLGTSGALPHAPGLPAPIAPSSRLAPTEAAPSTMAAWGQTTPPARSRKKLAVVAGLALLGLSAAGAAVVVVRGSLVAPAESAALVPSSPVSATDPIPAVRPRERAPLAEPVLPAESAIAALQPGPSATPSPPEPLGRETRPAKPARKPGGTGARTGKDAATLPTPAPTPNAATVPRPKSDGITDFGGRK